MNNSEECEIVGDAALKTSKPTKWKYWLVPARDADASPVVEDDTRLGKPLPPKGASASALVARMRCTDDGLRLDLRILTPESEQLRQSSMQELRERKRWRQYYDTLKSFDNLPYAYAISTHKSQGSSINYIFPDIADMRPCPGLQKILYTALTRAKVKAFIPQ